MAAMLTFYYFRLKSPNLSRVTTRAASLPYLAIHERHYVFYSSKEIKDGNKCRQSDSIPQSNWGPHRSRPQEKERAST